MSDAHLIGLGVDVHNYCRYIDLYLFSKLVWFVEVGLMHLHPTLLLHLPARG